MKKIIFILLCSWFTICAAGAQCAAKNEAIQAGELLTYSLKFNWEFIWEDACHKWYGRFLFQDA